MSGSTAVTQATPSYECQVRGTGVRRQDALDSIDPQGVADGAFAYVVADDTLWRWYQGNATAPGVSVIQPIVNPTFGRWLLITSPVAPASYYQYITDQQLDSAIPLTRTTIALPQAPTLDFINLSASGDATVSHITAHNQQIVYEDALTPAAAVVENKRARMRFVQYDDISSDVGRILDVADSAAADETVITIYEPAYQQVQYAAASYQSHNLKFVGTPVSVADDGTTTTVTISAAVAVDPWADVLGIGNTTDGHDPTVNGNDTLYLTAASKMYVEGTAIIQLDNPDNTIQWAQGGLCTLSYSGTGVGADGGYFAVGMNSTTNLNASASLRLFEGEDTADEGGQVLLEAGDGGSTGDGGAMTLSAGDGGIGGYVLLVSGTGSKGSSGAVTVRVANTTGTGAAAGTLYIEGGNASDGDGGLVSISSGTGVSDGADLTVTSGLGGAGNGGTIWLTGGAGTANGGSIRVTTGDGGSGTGGNVVVTTGTGALGGQIQLITGAGSSSVGGPIGITSGAGTSGGPIDITSGAGSSSAGGSIGITSGQGPEGGPIDITSGEGTAGEGGGVHITTGDGTTYGGDVEVTCGNGSTGGAIHLTSGSGSGTGGGINLFTGAGGTSFGGALNISTSPGTAGGGVNILTGKGNVTTGGDLFVNLGSGVTTGGSVTIYAGTGTASGGAINVKSGKGTSANGGNIAFTTGAGKAGGGFSVTTGTGTSGNGGGTQFTLGDGLANGGDFSINCGAGGTAGGTIFLTAGTGNSQAGGSVQIYGGEAGVTGQLGFIKMSPYVQLADSGLTPTGPSDTPGSGGYLFAVGNSLYWKRSTSGSVYQLA